MVESNKNHLKQIQVNIDTKNDGLEQCTSFQTWLFRVSMIDFEGVSPHGNGAKGAVSKTLAIQTQWF